MRSGNWNKAMSQGRKVRRESYMGSTGDGSKGGTGKAATDVLLCSVG